MQNTWLLLRNGDGDAKNSIFGYYRLISFFRQNEFKNSAIFCQNQPKLAKYYHFRFKIVSTQWNSHIAEILEEKRVLYHQPISFSQNQPFLQKSAKSSQKLIFLRRRHHFSIKVIYSASFNGKTNSLPQRGADLKNQPFFSKNWSKLARFHEICSFPVLHNPLNKQSTRFKWFSTSVAHFSVIMTQKEGC